MDFSTILSNLKIQQLNAMQQASVGAWEEGNDIVLLSPTGSGKTLAYLLPLVSSLKSGVKGVQAVVLVPSRELALQTEQVFKAMGTGFAAMSCYGGRPAMEEHRVMKSLCPSVIIGTPGRMNDHLGKQNIDASTVSLLVIDEFDKCLEFGFQEEMAEVIGKLPRLKRRFLLSATDAEEIPRFTGLNRIARLDFLQGEQSGRLRIYQVLSPVKDKLDTLYKLLGELRGEPALVFCNYRESVDRVGDYLQQQKVEAVCFHGGLEQPEREQRLARLANGSTAVFITTDLAARGLDIPEVRHIVHYHLPLNEEAFVHRNGRTARMHATGTAYLLLNPIEEVPAYIPADVPEFFLPDETRVPKPAAWETLHINKGKRDKVSRGDIVGFLCQKGGLKPEEVGRIDVFESCALVAVRRGLKKNLLACIRNEKIKNKQAKYS